MANTPVPNENYDVVSVLYHLLEGSDTVDKYCEDAERAGDKELSQFFREVQTSNNQMAEKAQAILKNRLQ
jgi:hypothetical protein